MSRQLSFEGATGKDSIKFESLESDRDPGDCGKGVAEASVTRTRRGRLSILGYLVVVSNARLLQKWQDWK